MKELFTTLSKLTIQQIVQQLLFSIKRKIILCVDQAKDNRKSGQLDMNNWKSIDVSDGLSFDLFPQHDMDTGVAEELYCMYISHRFDLLGSGWVRCGFIDNAPGLEGYKYPPLVISDTDKNGDWIKDVVSKLDFPKSRDIFQKFVPHGYEPIDWQKDYKTGYRWNASDWYQSIKVAEEPGVDIKVPWELSRMEHLPQMAIFYKMFPDKHDEILREFMSQCADFIAQNPVRKGVNWKCTMDVGIRTANMVMAYWLFVSCGAGFPDDFTDLFANSIFQHCKHVRNNLEWSASLRSNHYFADICGLFFGAAFLRKNIVAQNWLKFARKEFSKELQDQFHEEGSNFEGSIGYHRLTGEMVAYTGLLIQHLSQRNECKALSDQELILLGKIKRFAMDTMTPDGNFVQIGDNDSGRFFKLLIKGELMTEEEAKKKYASLDGYIPETPGEMYFDEKVNSPLQMIAVLEHLERHGKDTNHFKKNVSVQKTQGDNKEFPFEEIWEICPEQKGKSLQEGLQYVEYPQFGIYIFRSERIYLCLNGSDNGQKGNAGHAHNDKLSFELWIDNDPVYQDPGTYVYTAILEERDRYRSVHAHNGLLCGREQNRFRNTFSMENETVCRKIMQAEASIMLEVCFGEVVQRRTIEIGETGIIIRDGSNHAFTVNKDLPDMTEGYGKKFLQKREV